MQRNFTFENRNCQYFAEQLFCANLFKGLDLQTNPNLRGGRCGITFPMERGPKHAPIIRCVKRGISCGIVNIL
jgi:hypothetical protein